MSRASVTGVQQAVEDCIAADADSMLGKALSGSPDEVQHAMLQHVRATILPEIAKRIAVDRLGDYATWLDRRFARLAPDVQLRVLGQFGSRVAARLQDITLRITSTREQE